LPDNVFQLLFEHPADGALVNFIETAHGSFVAGRRARVLAARLAEIMPPDATVLDVGCGDGEIAWLLMQHRPDLKVTGVDVLVRPDTRVPVEPFNGHTLPFADDSFDVVSFVDVLHHCEKPLELLTEARRVALHSVVIKDHSHEGLAAGPTLRFMDGVGNRRYGVALPYNYWSPDQWSAAFAELGLTVEQQLRRLGLYPWPLTLAFDRRLHFLARLRVPAKTEASQSQDLLAAAGIS
jgi:SAM-dependent methyltransferase